VKKSPISAAAACRLAAGIILILLAGCSTAPSRPVAVTAPPPPIIGSAPITAYDAYALVIAPDSEPRTSLARVAANP